MLGHSALGAQALGTEPFQYGLAGVQVIPAFGQVAAGVVATDEASATQQIPAFPQVVTAAATAIADPATQAVGEFTTVETAEALAKASGSHAVPDFNYTEIAREIVTADPMVHAIGDFTGPATATTPWQSEAVQAIPDFGHSASAQLILVPDWAIEIIKFAREDRTFYKAALSPIVIAAQSRRILIPAIDNRVVIYNESQKTAFDPTDTNSVAPEDRLTIIRRAA